MTWHQFHLIFWKRRDLNPQSFDPDSSLLPTRSDWRSRIWPFLLKKLWKCEQTAFKNDPIQPQRCIEWIESDIDIYVMRLTINSCYVTYIMLSSKALHSEVFSVKALSARLRKLTKLTINRDYYCEFRNQKN